MKKLCVLLGIGLLAACGEGQKDPPTPLDVQQNIQYLHVQADGRRIPCIMYAAKGNSSGADSSTSWFALDCDWHPGER